MATVVKRLLRATPQRTAAEVWLVITELVAPDKSSTARAELNAISGLMGQIIASEALKDDPLVFFGSGPRLRIYCLYNEDAIGGDGESENSLAFVPTDGDWRISIPCLSEDLAWVQTELKRRAAHITARVAGEPVEDEEDDTPLRATNVAVDTGRFLRP
jgi:hypothetical protein